MNGRSQLCWNCQNAFANKGCWIGCEKEVDGWEAEKVKVRNLGHELRIEETYLIKKCPNFVKDEVKEESRENRIKFKKFQRYHRRENEGEHCC